MTPPKPLSARRQAALARQAAELGITPAERLEDLSFLSVYGARLPEVSAEKFPRAQRRQRIHAALETDGVLTREQLVRYFNADTADLEGLQRAPHLIEPVHMRATVVTTEFCGLHLRSVNRRPSLLAHTVATAEARLALGVAPEDWKVSSSDAEVEPDAVYTTPSGKRLAVEYDRGTYNHKKVIYKMLAFAAAFDGTLWVVPPPALTLAGVPYTRHRKRHIQEKIALSPELSRVRHTTHVMVACWWKGAKLLHV